MGRKAMRGLLCALLVAAACAFPPSDVESFGHIMKIKEMADRDLSPDFRTALSSDGSDESRNLGDTNECTCYPGFLGDQCTLKCPGRERKGSTLTVCSGQGDCTVGEDGTATCNCMPGFLGRKCNLLCPG